MRLSKFPILLALFLFFVSQGTQAQTVIFSDNGTSYNNTDAVTTNTYGPVNISNCSSISFSLQYNFSLPFPGGGNMESSDECPFGTGCAGDPNDPSGGGCANCWDFIYVQYQIGGVTVTTRLVGVPGSLNQSGTLSYGPVCTNGATTAGIIVQTQTWAANESITFSNISITCWDASATLMVNPNPVCSGSPFTLSSTLTNPGSVATTLWTGPGTITTPANLSTTVTNAPLGTSTYTFTATDDNACTDSNTIDVTVNQSPTLDDPPNITVCADDPVNVAFTGTVNPTVNWTNSNPAIGLGASGTGDLSFTAAMVANPTTGTVTITPSENGCTGPSQSFTITVNPIPSVNQPNNVNVCSGAQVVTNFTGSAGTTFNWTNDNPAIGLGASGSGNLNFTSANVATQEVGNITVTPSNNGCPGTPLSFTITINPAPTVADPADQTVCAGDPVDVLFSGSVNPSFNWTNSNSGIGLGANGMGDISFTAANVAVTTTGIITVTPNEGGCPGPAQNFSITVNPVPSVNQPSDVNVCSGASVVTNFTGSAGTTFNWVNDNPAIGLGASGSGNLNFTSANVATQEVANITVTPSNIGCPGVPLSFTITINPAPTVADPANQTVCAGDPVNVVFSGSVNPTFSWTNSNPGIGLGANGMGDIAFTAANVVANTTGTITVTPTEGGCPGIAQNFTITVTPTPSVNQPGNVAVCAGAQVVTNFAGSVGATFNWTNDNPAIGLGASGSGNLNFTSANVAVQQVANITVTPSNSGCPGAPLSFTITVNPTPSVADPADQTVCAGSPVNIVFNGSGTFNWTNSNVAIGLGASGSGDISFTTANVANTTTGNLSVTPTLSGCPGVAQNFTITVNPIPSVNQPGNVAVCAGQQVTTNFAGSAGATFNWTNDNPAIGLGASGSGNLNFTSANVAVQQVANITVTPSNNGCPGAPLSFTITVNPAPTVADPADQTVCAGDPVNVVFNGSGTFNWTNSNVAIGLGASGSGDINFTTANVVNTTTGNLTVTPTLSGCPGAAQNFTITVTPIPSVNQPGNVAVCAGEQVVTNFAGSAGATFNWTNDNPAIGLGASGSGNLNFTSANVAVQQVANITVTPTNNGCPGASLSFTITINPAPTVADPADQTVCAGAPVNVVFNGSGTFNWTNSNVAIGLGASGSGDISFTTANVANTTTGNLSVTPTLAGCPGAAQNFTITVNAIPNVNQPGNVSVCAGEQVATNFTGSVGATFNWVNDNPAIGLGASGSGNLNFTSANVAVQQVANITLTPLNNSCLGSPIAFTITVNPSPTVADQPNQTVCSGNPVLVTFSGTNNPVFDWTNNNPGIGLAASGSGNISFVAGAAGVGTITVTPTENGCVGIPQMLDITVVGLPVANQPSDLSACAGDPVALAFTGTAGATYTWTNSNPGIGLAASGTGDISFNAANVGAITVGTINVTPSLNGCTGATQGFDLTINPLPSIGINTVACASDLLSYDISLSSSGTTISATAGTVSGGSGNFTISGIPAGTNVTITSTITATGCQSQQTVNAPNCSCPPVMSATAPNSPVICEGAPNPTLTVTTAPGTTVDWYAAPSGGAPLLAGSTSYTPVGVLTPGIYSFYAEARDLSTSCTSSTRLEVTITVNAVPAVVQPLDQSVCAGTQLSVNFSGTGAAVMNWTNSNVNIGLGASGSGDLSFLTTNTGSTPEVANLVVTPSLNGCTGTAQNFTITVNPIPNVTAPGNQTQCSGAPISINFIGTGGATLDWTNSNTIIGLGASGTGNINFIAANVGTPGTGNIAVTPALSGCTGLTQNFSITINPTPSVSAPASPSVCVGSPVALNFSGSNGATFDWTNSNPGIGLGASGAGNISFTSTNAGNTPLTGNLVVTPSQNGCTGAAQNFTITVNPLPSLVVDSTDCSSDLTNYSIFVQSNANTLNASVGTVSGNTPNFSVTGIPIASNVMLTVTNTTTGCTQQASVNAPNCNCAPVNAASAPNNPSICEGSPTPALSVLAAPGTTIDWYAASSGGLPLLIGSNSYTPAGTLTPGVYTFYAEAREPLSNCTSSTRLTVTLTVNEVPVVAQPADQSVCPGATVNVNFTGTAAATLGWTNSNTAIGLVANGTGNISFSAINTGNTPLMANFGVTPSLNTCIGTPQSFTITVNPLPQLTVDSTNCSADLSTYTLHVSTNANALVSNLGTVSGMSPDFDILGIPNATDVVLSFTNTITGCINQQTVNGPNCNCAPVNAATQPNNPAICAGTQNPALTVTTTSGLTVDWYATPAGGTPVLAGNTSYTPAGILAPGIYPFYAEARDISTDCTSSTRLEVTLTVNAIPVVQIAGNTTLCAGDATTLTASGGSNFSWSSGASTAVIQVNPANTSTYTTTVTENGCTASASVTVTVLQPTTATVNILSCDPAQVGVTTTTIPNAAGCDSLITTMTTLDINCLPAPVLSNGTVSCFGNVDGTLSLSTTTGVAPFQYNWSNGLQSGSGQIPNTGSAIQIQNLAAGTYTVTITGANGLTSTISAVVTSPPALTAQATAQLIFGQQALSCNGASDASIQATANGGSPQYQYTWSVPGQHSALLTNVGAGNYLLTVTDAHQCTATSSVTIQDPPTLRFDLALADVECGESTTAALITPSNGVEPFSVRVDGALAAGGLLPILSVGNHVVELQDANGCTADTMVLVDLPAVPLISLPAEAIVAQGETLVLEAQTNLSSWQSLIWNPTPDTSCAHCLRQTWIPVNSGQYEVVITDHAGCSASASVRVLVNKQVHLYIPNVFTPNGDGANDFWTIFAGASVLNLKSLHIFDRWGDMVYALNEAVPVNAWPGWDGNFRDEPVNPGVFVYYLEVELVNGEVVLASGDLTVVR